MPMIRGDYLVLQVWGLFWKVEGITLALGHAACKVSPVLATNPFHPWCLPESGSTPSAKLGS